MAEDQSREHDERQKVQRTEQSVAGPEGVLAPENAPLYPTSLLSDPRLSGRGNGPVRNALMLQMQRTYGNRATKRFLQRKANVNASTTPTDANLAIQRNGGPSTATAPSNIQKLDGLLDKFDVPEDEVIALLGKLNPAEKSTVLSGHYKGKIASALNTGEMVRAVNNLDPPLTVKLEWVEAAAGGASSIDYPDIRAMVSSAPQAQKDALKTAPWRDFFVGVCTNKTMPQAVNDLGFDLATKLEWMDAEIDLSYSDIKSMIITAPADQKNALKTIKWRDFFVDVCTNKTMAEAVTDLGFDLATKLDWMIEEGTDYKLVSGVIRAAPAGEKTAALADQALLRRLMDELSWNDFAKSVELLGRQVPAQAAIQAAIVGTLAAAWTDSLPADPAKRHEEGGWIYLNLVTGDITTQRAGRGAGASIDLTSPPTVGESTLIGNFHTHPNPTSQGWMPGPSPRDITNATSRGTSGFIRADNGNHIYGPSRLHLAGDRGYPGTGGGISPQAKQDGTEDEE